MSKTNLTRKFNSTRKFNGPKTQDQHLSEKGHIQINPNRLVKDLVGGWAPSCTQLC